MTDDELLGSLRKEWEEVSTAEDTARRCVQRLEEICRGEHQIPRPLLPERANPAGYRELVEAERDFSACEERCSDVRRRIALTQARTLEGILFKTKVARWCYASDDNDDVQEVIRSKIAAEVPYGPVASTICESVVADLARLEMDKEAGGLSF